MNTGKKGEGKKGGPVGSVHIHLRDRKREFHCVDDGMLLDDNGVGV